MIGLHNKRASIAATQIRTAYQHQKGDWGGGEMEEFIILYLLY